MTKKVKKIACKIEIILKFAWKDREFVYPDQRPPYSKQIVAAEQSYNIGSAPYNVYFAFYADVTYYVTWVQNSIAAADNLWAPPPPTFVNRRAAADNLSARRRYQCCCVVIFWNFRLLLL